MKLPAALAPWAGALEGLAVVLLGAVVFSAGWTVNGWRLGNQLSNLRAQYAQADATAARTDLTQVKQAAAGVAQAASEAVASVNAARARFAALEAPYAKPLPTDCRPDDERLRRRNAAIEAYNLSRAGSVPGP